MMERVKKNEEKEKTENNLTNNTPFVSFK